MVQNAECRRAADCSRMNFIILLILFVRFRFVQGMSENGFPSRKMRLVRVRVPYRRTGRGVIDLSYLLLFNGVLLPGRVAYGRHASRHRTISYCTSTMVSTETTVDFTQRWPYARKKQLQAGCFQIRAFPPSHLCHQCNYSSMYEFCQGRCTRQPPPFTGIPYERRKCTRNPGELFFLNTE